MARKIYISLGTGENQLPLIKAAKKQKFKVLGVDRDPMSPGMALCDYRIIESITNYRKVLYKISTLWYDGEIEGGYSASFGNALLSWSYLAEKLSLPALPRPLAEALLDKYEVRKRLEPVCLESGTFKQPLFLAVDPSLKQKTPLQIEFPIIVKPRSGWAKSNIKTVKNRAELNKVLKLEPPKKAAASKTVKKKKTSPLPKAVSDMILEEIIEGDEITVCGLIQDFKFTLLSISDKITSDNPPFIELEHIFPSKFYHMEEKITNAHQAITEKLQLTDCPVVSEWKIKDGELYLIEISLQIPGEYIGSFIIPDAVRYDYFTNLVKMSSGRPISRKVKKRRFKRGVVRFFEGKISHEEEAGIRKRARFYNVLNENPSSPPKSNHDRYAVAGFIG